MFDLIIVITDRSILDRQNRETIHGLTQVLPLIGSVTEGSGSSKTEQLTRLLRDAKKIVIARVQKFPFVLVSIGDERRRSRFTWTAIARRTRR